MAHRLGCEAATPEGNRAYTLVGLLYLCDFNH